MDNIPVMLKIKEVPLRFPGVTEHAVRRFVATGEIPAVRVGTKFLINEQNMADFLIRGNNSPEPEPSGKIRKL